MKPKVSKEQFKDFSKKFFSKAIEGEDFALAFHGERSEFCRVNNSKIRQAGDVFQLAVNVTYTKDRKKMYKEIPYTNDLEKDLNMADSCLEYFRSQVTGIQEDPHFVEIANNGSSSYSQLSDKLYLDDICPQILEPAQDVDLAGIWTSGELYRGTSNTKGENHWFESSSFYFDYSLYTKSQKAVKGLYAGTEFNKADYEKGLNKNKAELELMERPSKKVERGKYRTYLAPAAVAEILGTVGWGTMGYGSYKRGRSALKDLKEGHKKLSEKFNLNEDFSLSLNPSFNSFGEKAPSNLELIKNGELKNLLISTRSAVEYGVEANGAENGEPNRSMVVAPGNLKQDEILKELGTGLYINNLHYLNWSDLQGGRITGMTRFASFWVEDGKIVCPINDLRFDETIYNIFGENLLELTSESEVSPNLYTYGKRGMGGLKTPGALVKDFTFTL